MKLKLILGIIIPLVIIVVLAMLGSLDIGFEAKKSFEKKLTLDDMFVDGNLRQTVKVGEIKLTNDYFLGKRYDLPKYKACLVDRESLKPKMDAANVVYSEGDYTYEKDIIYDSNYYGRSGAAQSVQVDSNSNKTVYIYLNPTIYVDTYRYDYTNPNNPKAITKTFQESLLEQYGAYDEIVLVENKKTTGYNYASCSNFQEGDIINGVHISLRNSNNLA